MKLKLKLPPSLKTPLIVSGVITGGLLVVALISFLILQPEVPIFYSLGAKNEWLAPKIWLFLFPVLSLAMTLGHFLLLIVSKSLEKTITQLFAWATVFIQAILALSLVRIIFIIS